jgi:acetyl esterase/lipase
MRYRSWVIRRKIEANQQRLLATERTGTRSGSVAEYFQMPWSLLAVTMLLLTTEGCRPGGEPTVQPTPSTSVSPTDDLATARKGFSTKLRVRGSAPQRYQNEKPPAGVKEVEYTSGELKLKGWLSADAGDGKKRSAVVYLHGGWAFGDGDWEDAEPFAKAGFVLFMPMLRGENGNPGNYESFLGEADDAIAAGQFVSLLPNVDPDNVFVAGHSVGAVLTCLTSMLPSPYRAAAALDGYVDMESWVSGSPDAQVPYDRNTPEEIWVRNPMAFASSIRCPLRLYVGEDGQEVNAPLAVKAQLAGKDCELVSVRGDHQGMVAPAVQQAIGWFRQLAAK